MITFDLSTQTYNVSVPQFNITLSDSSFDITVKKAHIVRITNAINYIHIVIIYNIKGIINNISIECDIPYYISDGYTNGINGNFLLPFICFQNKDSEDCPRNNIIEETPNIILKYLHYKNISFYEINKKILDNITFCLNQIDNDDLKRYYLETRRVGLGSVLLRFENFINLFISIVGNVKLNKVNVFNEYLYIPCSSADNIDKYTKCSFNPYTRNDINEFKLINHHTKQKYNTLYNDLSPELKKEVSILKRMNKTKSRYRREILNYLDDLKNEFNNLLKNILTINYVNIPIKISDIITDVYFNKIYNICTKNDISQKTIINNKNYNYISYNFMEKIFNYIQTLNLPYELLLKIYKDSGFPKYYSYELKDYFTTQWNSKCINI